MTNTADNRLDDKTVVIDHTTGTVTIDGEPYPFLVEKKGPTVEAWAGLSIVHIPTFVLASSVTVIRDEEDS